MFRHGSEIVFRFNHLRPRFGATEDGGAEAAGIVMSMFGYSFCVAQVACSDLEQGTYNLEGWPSVEVRDHQVMTVEEFTARHPGEQLYRRDF